MDIDKPLEEIIASKSKAKRASRPAKAPSATRDRYAANVPRNAPRAAAPPRAAAANKILISNLPQDVTEAAVRSTVGPVQTVQMSFTATGRSTGQATVVFRNRGDANKAYASYHNRMIDNQRPLKVEIAVDMNAIQPLAARVAPARGPPAARSKAHRPARKQKKTAEELDAEMSAYKETA